MTNYNIRPLTNFDAIDAAALWKATFGDDERLVYEFFRLFDYLPTFGMCAEYEGRIVAAAYCPTGIDLVVPGEPARRAAYLYAVATDPEHRNRGLSKELCTRLKDAAFAAGCEYVFTKPSEESLYPWYEEAIGAAPVLGCNRYAFNVGEPATMAILQMNPEAYGTLREVFLKDVPHIRFNDSWLTWEQHVHEWYGGGFFAVGHYAADMYYYGDTLVINELIPPADDETVAAVCNALMNIAEAEKCTCVTPGNRENYVSCAANQCELPKNNPWFGPVFG